MDAVYKPPAPTAPPIFDYPPTNYTSQLQPPTGVPIIHKQVQPQAYNYQITTAGVPGAWSTGLCDCFSDVSNCFITCLCPCITFGYIAEIVDRGSTSCVASGALYGLIAYLTGCSWVYSCFYRSKMRSQYMLDEDPCPDCIVHFCCECCALCQEYRELQHRGFDMSIGWQGNVERHNQGGVRMAPFVQGGMNR